MKKDISANSEIPAQQDGVLVLNKPKGPTSAWCIGQIKRGLGQKKIGHAGTLDPMAEGVLLVLLGQATKISGYLMGEESHKTYSGIIHLGIVTDTWDAEGKVLEKQPADHIRADEVQAVFSGLIGTYEQEVPAYSAAKHQGKPLYALARQGKEVPVKKKHITVLRGEAELVGPSRVHFRVTCSSGTYIRSLAHSLGSRLGCGAMLEELTREYSHPFSLSMAHPLADVLEEPEGFARKVIGIADALPDWPKLQLLGNEASVIRNGGRIVYDPARMSGAAFASGMRAVLQTAEGIPLALAETASVKGESVWVIMRGLWNQ